MSARRDELLALATRLEAAIGADPELNTAIHEALHGPLGELERAPPVTDSLDAALSLVPEGLLFTMTAGYGQACVNVKTGSIIDPATKEWTGHGKTPALAMCASSLRARAATLATKENGDD